MHVMPSHPYEREHTMTQEKSTQARANLKALMAEDKDFLREIVRETMQQTPRSGDDRHPGRRAR